MIINVGSKNPAKVQAVINQLRQHKKFEFAAVTAHDVPSGVRRQPLQMEEIIRGAYTRALHAIAAAPCDYSFGIESGVFRAPGTGTWMDVCACVILNGDKTAKGKTAHYGLSSAFEVPHELMDVIIDKNVEMNDACQILGYSKDNKLGSKEGLVGLLTGGKVTRQSYTEQAIQMAIFHIT